MGEPILKASDVPTKLPPNKDQSVVKSDLNVDGVIWNVTCISMGNPHCVTFGTKGSQVCIPDNNKHIHHLLKNIFTSSELLDLKENGFIDWFIEIHIFCFPVSFHLHF